MTQQQIGSRLPGKACKAKCLFGVSSIVRKFCLVSYMIYNMYNKLMRHGLFVYNVCFVDYFKVFPNWQTVNDNWNKSINLDCEILNPVTS